MEEVAWQHVKQVVCNPKLATRYAGLRASLRLLACQVSTSPSGHLDCLTNHFHSFWQMLGQFLASYEGREQSLFSSEQSFSDSLYLAMYRKHAHTDARLLTQHRPTLSYKQNESCRLQSALPAPAGGAIQGEAGQRRHFHCERAGSPQMRLQQQGSQGPGCACPGERVQGGIYF